jgi:hypothetical protein
VVRRKNNGWREWFKERTEGGKKEKWKGLNRAVKCKIKFENEEHAKVCVGLGGRLQRKQIFICSNVE